MQSYRTSPRAIVWDARIHLAPLVNVNVADTSALLPSSGVEWSPVDDRSARVTLTDRGTTASAIFSFGPRGEIARVSAQRYRDVDGAAVLTPWVGNFREYRCVQGMMVPMYGEVAWIVRGGIMSYFRGGSTNITFELAA